MSFAQLRTKNKRIPLLLFEEPTVTTQDATGIGSSSATGNGTVVNVGGSALTERGFVWSINPQPTTADSKVIEGGTTTGAYSATMSGLSASTVYNYRAYAINAIGTAYGDNVQFTTTAGVPGPVTTRAAYHTLAYLGAG